MWRKAAAEASAVAARAVAAARVATCHPRLNPAPLPSAWAGHAPNRPAAMGGWHAQAVRGLSRGAPPPAKGDGEGPLPQKKKAELAMCTCGVCDERSVKGFSRRAYEHGVVMVDCPGCGNKHLIADRLGWFGEPGSVEDFLKSKGEAIYRGGVEGTLEVTPEDLQAAGLSPSNGGDGGDGAPKGGKGG